MMKAITILNGDTRFDFGVEGIGSIDDYETYDYWVKTFVHVKNRFFNYENHGELFEYGDLISIRDNFDKLLANHITCETDMSFVEPDFEFILKPQVDLRTIPGEWCREGYEIMDISVYFFINLTDNDFSYNGERYILSLDREEITLWRNYLTLAIEEYKINIKPNCRFQSDQTTL